MALAALALRLPVVEGLMACPFPDVETPADAFYPDDVVTTAAINQIVSGYADGTFRPYAAVSRRHPCSGGFMQPSVRSS